MKIVVIGASGTIGKVVCDNLSVRHEVVKASRSSGDIEVDISSLASIKNMYNLVKNIDAIVCCAGVAHFGPLDEMTQEKFYVGIQQKMMGQVNLVLEGQHYLNTNGSFTLTTGILADEPVYKTINSSLVNGGLNSFTFAVSQELKGGLRINAIAPGLVEHSVEKLAGSFPGYYPVSMDKVAAGYQKSVEGIMTGRVLKIY